MGAALWVATVILASSFAFVTAGGSGPVGPAVPGAPLSPAVAGHAVSTPSAPPRPTAGGVPAAPVGGAGPLRSSPPFVPRLGAFTVPGPHPRGWGSAGVPPGAEALGSAIAGATAASAAPMGSTPAWDNRFCSGLWPWATNDSTAQSYYANGCYGHDEPGIEFYSGLNGSGGNVSWNVTLPVDRSATQNQSDLYVAIWFGMTLNDPYAWMHQCFLELQFYPDQLWTNPGPVYPGYTVNGRWIGAAVAWEINASSGYEDPCFYQPLYLGNATGGPGFFNMTQGDHLDVTMTGWANNPAGESIVVHDLTQGIDSSLVMYNAYEHYPLDPSYATNSFENGLQWTPGGEYPVVFAFENGHAGNPAFPANNSYGGCSPGKPPSTPTDPSVPCPSYDPGSWANDTLHPWKIGTPTFFAGATTATPAQVAFTQDFGGALAISSIGNGACTGQLGSAYCSYPWYSYSCPAHAFEFGATDYPGVSNDFGQYNEYSQVLETNGLGFGFFPPTNFSIPTCGQSAYNVTVGPGGVTGGAVYFLSRYVTGATGFGPLLPGQYSIRPYAPTGAGFTGWSTTGGVTILGSSLDPWATLVVEGPGSVTADFGASPATTVTFDDAGTAAPGTIVLSPARLYTDGHPLATLANGSSYSLAPGIYGVQALPPPGANFSGWSVAGASISVAPAYFPYAWLDVLATGGNATLTAEFVPSASTDTAYVYVGGSGNVSLNGTSTSSSLVLTVPVGAYPLVATPAAGWAYAGLFYGSSAVVTDFDPMTNVSLENGSSYLYVEFTPLPVPVNVTILDAPSRGGAVSADGGATYVRNGTVIAGFAGYTVFSAAPSGGYAFTGWSVNNSALAYVLSPRAAVTYVELNGSVTLTASFAASRFVSVVGFRTVPAAGGQVGFNGVGYANGSANASVANGTYALLPEPAPGYSFTGGISVTGNASLTSTYLGPAVTVTGAAQVTVDFASVPATLYAVTFVANDPYGVTAALGNRTLTSGATTWLAAGTYPLLVTTLANETFDAWSAAPGLGVVSAPSAATTLVIAGSGTITAIAAPFGVAAVALTPNPADVGRPVSMQVTVNGSGPFSYAWSLPSGCASANASALTCSVMSAGSYPISVEVTDAFGAQGGSPPVALIVHGPVVAAITFSPGTIDLGMTTNVSVAVSGGTAPFAYVWQSLPPGCAGTGSVLGCRPTASGTFGLVVNVSDALGASALVTADLVVNALPTVSQLLISPATTDVGVATTVLVSVAGGTAPFTYAYSGLPGGCAGASAASFPCTPTTAGDFVVHVNVTDLYGVSAQETASLTVEPAPTLGPLRASPPTLDVGMTTTVSTTPAGGTTPYAYTWSGLPPGCVGTNASVLPCVPSAPGPVTVILTLTDARGASAQASVALTVNALPSIGGFTVSRSSVALGSAVTFSTTASGGTGGLRVGYTGLPPGCSGANASSISCAPTAVGHYAVTVTVTDALGQSANATVALEVTAVASGNGPAALGYLTLGLVVLAALILGGAVLLLRRRRRPPRAPTPWTPGAAGAGPEGGSTPGAAEPAAGRT